MTANRKRATLVFAGAVFAVAVMALAMSNFWFGFASVGISMIALWPMFMAAIIVWFGYEVLSSLRRIESIVEQRAEYPTKFNHGA